MKTYNPLTRLLSLCLFLILALFQSAVFAQTAADTQIRNIATVSFTDATGANSYNNSSNEVVVTVAKVAGLVITPDAQVDSAVVPGQTGVVKTFRVMNIGNFTDSVVFGANGSSLRVIGGATITSAVVGSTDILTNGSAVSQSLAQNGFVDVTVTLSINSNATLGSTVQVYLGDATTGTNFDNVAADNSANEVHTVSTGATNGAREARGDISFPVNASDLTVSKTHTGSFTVGSTGTYTLTATNAGNIATSGTITITDTLPTGLTVNGGTAGTVTIGGTNAANWSCSSNANSPQVVTCTSTTAIAASGTSVLTLTTNVGANIAVGTNSVTNTATISGGGETNTSNNSTTDPTTILAPDLTITKSHTGNFTIGALGNYTLTVQNIGTVATSGTITITDSLPTGLTVSNGTKTLSGANAANWTCIAASNVITCTSSTAIAVSGSSTFSFNVSVGASAGTGVTNTATVSGGNEPTVNNGNNTSSDPTTVGQTPFSGCDSRMYLSQSPSNTINSTLYNISTSTNPFTFSSIRQGSYPYGAIGYNPNDNFIYAMLNVSFVGNSIIRIGADGTTVNLGVVSGLPVGDYVAAEISPTGVYYVWGKTLPNVLYVIDIPTQTATTITLSKNILVADLAWKDGLLYTISTSGQFMSINPSTGVVTDIGVSSGAVDFGAMYGSPNGVFGNANNGSGFYQFDLTTGAKTLISASPGAVINDGAHCSNANITFGADIAVTKTDGQTNYSAGSNVVYTITATNNGPFGAQNVTVSDPLPSGITTASWTCTGANGGTCAASGTGAINDTTVDLPVGATATYTLTMAVPSGFTGSLVNTATATVGSSNTDPTPANNSATDTDAPNPDLTIAKSHTPSNFTVGSTGTYTITASNIGTGTTSGTITITDTLPTGLTVNGGTAGTVTLGGTNAANWSCSSNATSPQTITCTSSTAIANGGSSTFNFTVNVGASTPVGTNSITNTAVISGGGETNTSNNTGSDTTTVYPDISTVTPIMGCSADGYLVNGNPSSLYLIDLQSGNSNFVAAGLGGNGSGGLNAAGYNPLDGRIYARSTNPPSGGNNDLSIYAIGANGTYTVYGFPIPGMPTTQAGNVGDVDGNGYLHITGGGGTNLTAVIDVTPSRSSFMTVVRTYSRTFGAGLTNANLGVDMVYRPSDGLFYSLRSGTNAQLVTMNPSTGEVLLVGTINGLNGNFGAQFMTANGQLLAVENTSGLMYRIDLTNPALPFYSAGNTNLPNMTNNDAASCPSAILTYPTDLAVTKDDGQTNYTAGSNVVYTITVTNNGAYTAYNSTVSDPLPSGITTANWSCVASGGGSCTASGTGAINDTSVTLPVGATATYTLTMAVPAGFTGSLVNTATATVSSINTDSNPSNNSATDTDGAGAPLIGLLKSCPSPANCTTAPQMPGTDLTYQINFTNTGGQGATNLTIVDRVPDFTDYKIGSATANVGSTGLIFAIEYSSDYDANNPTFATWTYTPVSTGGGAGAGYDRNVKAIRWRVTSGILSNVSPNNTGSASFVTKIR